MEIAEGEVNLVCVHRNRLKEKYMCLYIGHIFFSHLLHTGSSYTEYINFRLSLYCANIIKKKKSK